MRTAVELCFGIYLFLLSLQDIRKKEIPLVELLAGLVFAPFFIMSDDACKIVGYITGAIPGVVFLAVAYLSRGQIGQADACVLICIGLCMGVGPVIGIISASLILVAVTSMIMLIAGRLNRKSTLPFIPFIFAGYIFTAFLF